jgi:hypothetical protein
MVHCVVIVSSIVAIALTVLVPVQLYSQLHWVGIAHRDAHAALG